MVPTPTAFTPGSSRTRCTMLKTSRRTSDGSFFSKLKSISVTRSPAATKPGLRPAALSAPRKNKPAAKSNMRESAICDMTEMCRGEKNRRKEAKQECDPEDRQIRTEIQNEREVYVIKQSRKGVQQEIIAPHTE